MSTVGDYFFYFFNQSWALTNLPKWSFNIENITSGWGLFFWNFNESWKLTSLPAWSFKLSTWLTTAGEYFFYLFNYNWALTSLPDWSFDTSKITTAEYGFFAQFNQSWALTSLPEWSFRLSTWLTTVGDYFFFSFNYKWSLTNLPINSFNTENIITAGDRFFQQFNAAWALTGLPDGSFNISNINEVWDNAFRYFNGIGGEITSLPIWSFNTDNITTAGIAFFSYFNYNWKITNLPDSFKISSAWVSNTSGYQNAFNASSYTFNKKVSDLVNGVIISSSDMDTFSDNQPWRCGVHANWLVTTANACSISYDDRVWWTWEFKYTAYTTWVVVWSGMSVPSREWYTFSGWINASWNKVDEIVFPDMDGETLYANWEANVYTITLDIDGTLTI